MTRRSGGKASVVLALLVVLLAIVRSTEGATCTWGCGGVVTFGDAFAGFCWTCSDGGKAPNITHDISLTSSDATSVTIASPLSLRTLTLNGVALKITNDLSLFSSLTTVNSAVTVTGATLSPANSFGIRLTVSMTGGSLTADSMDLKLSNFDCNAVATITGNSSWTNSNVNLRNNATFVANKNGMQLWALDGTQIMNYKGVIIGDNANPTFEFLGDESTLFSNQANSWVIVGQGDSYGEVDMDMSFFLDPSATLTIPPHKDFQPKWFYANQATIILDGILRFDHTVSANIAQVNFLENTAGTLASFNDGKVIVTSDINLPQANLEISGGRLGFVAPLASSVVNATGTFKMISITSGGQIGNHGIDLTTRPLHAVLKAESFSVTQGDFDMVEGFGLEINANYFILQDWISLGDHTRLHLASGVVVINSDIRGHPTSTDSLVFGEETDVELYEAGQLWVNTTVDIRNTFKIFIPPGFTGSTSFVDARNSNVLLSSAQLEVVLNSPPSAWGTYSLIRSSSLANPQTSTISGPYACLGATLSIDATEGLRLNLPTPSVLPPTSLSATVVGDNAVLHWTAPASLPCYTSVSGYSVHIGDHDVYPTIQRSLALDVSVFPTCQIFQAHVQATLRTTFGLEIVTPASNTDPFTHIPLPPAPVGLASRVALAGESATATLIFSKNASTLCQCNNLLVGAYYQVSYLDSVINVTSTSAQVESLPRDHDIDFSVATVCQYNADPQLAFSPSSTITRVSTSETTTRGNNDDGDDNELSAGQIVGIVFGVVGGVVLGLLAGLLVAKRAYVKFGSDEKAGGL